MQPASGPNAVEVEDRVRVCERLRSLHPKAPQFTVWIEIQGLRHDYTSVNRKPYKPKVRSGQPLNPVILLGGSWVVVSRAISRITVLTTHSRGLMDL